MQLGFWKLGSTPHQFFSGSSPAPAGGAGGGGASRYKPYSSFPKFLARARSIFFPGAARTKKLKLISSYYKLVSAHYNVPGNWWPVVSFVVVVV